MQQRESSGYFMEGRLEKFEQAVEADGFAKLESDFSNDVMVTRDGCGRAIFGFPILPSQVALIRPRMRKPFTGTVFCTAINSVTHPPDSSGRQSGEARQEHQVIIHQHQTQDTLEGAEFFDV